MALQIGLYVATPATQSHHSKWIEVTSLKTIDGVLRAEYRTAERSHPRVIEASALEPTTYTYQFVGVPWDRDAGVATGAKASDNLQKKEEPGVPSTSAKPPDNLQQKEEPGKKFDAFKPPMALISSKAMMELAKVLGFGAKKYAEHNWRKGMSWSRLISAALRHISAFNDGEDLDPETGLPHTAHALCCLMFLTEYALTHSGTDDRYKPTPTP
jgi:hypothetical protein